MAVCFSGIWCCCLCPFEASNSGCCEPHGCCGCWCCFAGIMPFRQMLLEAGSSDNVPEQGTSDSVYSSSSTVAIVPRNSSTMLGVVVSSAIRPRTDDVQLPMVGDFSALHGGRVGMSLVLSAQAGATWVACLCLCRWGCGLRLACSCAGLPMGMSCWCVGACGTSFFGACVR
jgi:hypothetical protein